MRHFALLRGINVGKGNRIAMADLRRALTDRGLDDVRTLLNSGNVALESSLAPTAVSKVVQTAVTEEFGLQVAVIVRSVDTLAAVLAEDPFEGAAIDDSRYFIGFCAESPTAAAAKRFTELSNDAFSTAVRHGHLYVWCPAGMTRSGFAKVKVDKEIGHAVTMRNRRTVTKLAALGES